MKCKSIRKEIFDYLDKSLPDKQIQQVSGHIKNCIKCRKYFEFAQNIISVKTNDISEYKSNPYFYTRLKSGLQIMQDKKPAVLNWHVYSRNVIPALYVLLIMLAIFIGISLGNYNPFSASIDVPVAKNTTLNGDNYFNFTSANKNIFENNYLKMTENGNNKQIQNY